LFSTIWVSVIAMIDSAAVKMLMLKPIANQATQTMMKAICA